MKAYYSAHDAQAATHAWHTEAAAAQEKARIQREEDAKYVQKIEGYIKKAAEIGACRIWERVNADRAIYQRLIQHFRKQGFDVQEYDNLGMKITW